ncbi:MarR family winged helix-turn-helix transcriptional regulator [Pseudoneobacillus sp. C159]
MSPIEVKKLNHPSGDQATQVLRSFRKIQGQFGKWIQTSLAKNKMNMPQFWILQMVSHNPMIAQKQIGERIQLPKSTLSTNVDGLVTAGFLDRVIPEENRREVLLQLTKEGEQKVKDIHDDPDGIYQKMSHILNKMPEESIANLIEIHQQLLDLMSEESLRGI